jgi:hypothetical protein
MGPGPDAGKRSLENLMDLVPLPHDWLLRIFGDTREFQVGTFIGAETDRARPV